MLLWKRGNVRLYVSIGAPHTKKINSVLTLSNKYSLHLASYCGSDVTPPPNGKAQELRAGAASLNSPTNVYSFIDLSLYVFTTYICFWLSYIIS